MVDVKLSEYLTIYTRSFFICLSLSAIVFYIYSDPSLPYSVFASVIYVMIYMYFIINSKDGNDIISVMKTMKMSSIVVAMVEKYRYKSFPMIKM